MAKYSDIKGFTVQTLSTDTVASQAAGGSWASGGNLNTAKTANTGSGTQTAALDAGGEMGPPSTYHGSEEYNGSSWTEGGNLNSLRAQLAASQAGTQTATIVFLGRTAPGAVALNEEYNGSAWTELADLNTARRSSPGGVGTSTAALAVGGGNPDPTSAQVESWNGSSWTETTDLNRGRMQSSSHGTQTLALISGGYATPSPAGKTAETEQWNGSAWTEVGDLNTSRYAHKGGGTYTDAIAFAGYTTTQVAVTEHYDGTSWTELADMSTARSDPGSAGATGSSAITFGGNAPPYSNLTEEWTAPAVFGKQVEGQLYFNSTTNTFKETIQDVPAGVWSSGGNLNEGRPVGAGYGSSNLAAGLAGGGNSTDNEAYNGTSWTEVNELNTARSNVNGTGSFTAGLVVGGYPPNTANAESWNGTNFTEVADLNTARGYQSGAGTANTANIAIGGFSSPPTQRLTVCEQYDGSSWTEVGDLTRSAAMNSTGSTSGSPYTSALCIGGYNAPNSPNTYSDLVESWDGSSWTNSTAMSNRRTLPVGNGGSVTDVVVAGGGGSAARTEIWNGSSWTELGDPSISNKFRQSGGTASTTAGIMSGAPDGTPEASTEEWNAPLANKTIGSS